MGGETIHQQTKRNLEGAKVHFAWLGAKLAQEKNLTAEESTRTNKVRAILKFGEDSCELAKRAVDLNAWLHEFILVRPVTDSIVRLHYAVRVPNGWKGYDLYWANEDHKRLTQISRSNVEQGVTIPPAHTQELADLQTKMNALTGIKPMPDKLNDVLSAVIIADNAPNPDLAAVPKETRYLYNLLFKISHTIIHAHPGYLEQNFNAQSGIGDYPNFRGGLFVQAAYLVTRTVYHFRGWPNGEQVAKEFANKLGPLLPSE